jgi:cell division protein FtsL
MPSREGSPAAGDPEPSPRPRFTGRAAVLAVVICAIALALAYPIREYIAERRQIAALDAQDAALAVKVARLKVQERAYSSPTFIEQQAEDQLHMCFPSRTCYTVIGPARGRGKAGPAAPAAPWYGTLWASVREADKVPAK